ncbi:cysteine--tRNA ligase [Berryella wangjianweii]|uniref:Cysteine--tRNA ligase n=1 Tax=Berryella wangjianweii TaxID=2734634 RepID=A0A6M8J8F4_9ACTN|nr:cysteine--tRNA ligase [Berryella wangjianweii]QKF07142.1 cysteine--tRNA ligase [Berryella wangjianweii]
MIKIYDSQAREKRDFQMSEFGRVKMYVCGPTVYNYVHIGNARTFMSFDMVRRYLEWRGFDVIYVSNVTDIDDKIIARANEEGRSADEVAAEYTKAFIEDMRAVNVKDPTIRPKATNEVPEMIDLVREMVAEGYAYEVAGDVYFSVRTLPAYGGLSGRSVDDAESGHRALRTEGIADRKRDPADFAVWKAAKPGEPSWDSPWGPGRPGWHLECTVMSKKYLGFPFDIHGGGCDLIFPHHENERAQALATSSKGFANYWMHAGMLQVNAEKMSKSLGNFRLLRDVLRTVDPWTLRFLMLQTHYRSSLDFSEERLAEAGVAFARIKNAARNVKWAIGNGLGAEDVLSKEQVAEVTRLFRYEFLQAMDDDFNTSRGLSVVFDYCAQLNSLVDGVMLSFGDVARAGELLDLLVEVMGVLGIDLEAALALDDAASDDALPAELVGLAVELTGYAGDDPAQAAEALLAARAEARAQKNWAVADAVRDRMGALGLAIEDTPQGARVKRS